MATERVGVYRKYHGAIPTDANGSPLPRSEWPKNRPCRWAARWFGTDGARYSKSFETRKEAERFAESKQAAVRDGRGDAPPPTILKEFEKMYLKLRGDLSSRSLEEHERTLRRLREFFGADRRIDRITPLEARRFISAFRQRPDDEPVPAPATVNKLIRESRRIFREALDCELIRSNPFAGIRQEKVGDAGWQYVSPEHFRAFVTAAPSLRWRGMIALAYCCGLRLGEILHLTWGDVDFERQQLRVVRKPAHGAGESWTPKDKDLRIVPIPANAANVLTEAQLAAADGQRYVFVNSKGPATGDRVKRQNFTRDFQAIRRRAGVPKCTFHDLRKSYCTNLAGAVPLHVVQELAGHSDIRTTRKHYLQVREELVEQARRALDEVLK
ncbi:Tyrosine recombinase XerD [Phycisphaerae bacterium RAS1]|nr:Tyrosine recombinase XerD [Phycisphaerae bacterium RAS1]